MTREREKRLLAETCEALGVSDSSVTSRPLGGGLLGRSFLLSSPAGDWVARLPVDSQERYRLPVADERALLRDVAAEGLTPPVISTNSGDVLVTAYLNSAVVWSADNAREPENIDRIAQRLRQLHGLAHDLPQFHAASVAASYCRTAAAGQELTSEQHEWQRRYLDLANAYDEASIPEALCHQDLVASNILDDGELWFIDFEYAVRADPILDLASLASMNEYNSDERRHLLRAYFDADIPQFSEKRLDDVTSLLQLQSYFWALAECSVEGSDPAVRRFVENMTAVLR